MADKHARRFAFKATDDKGPESYCEVEGLEDETFSEVIRIQQHGFVSHPPKGSHCIGIPLNGSTDQIAVLGGESSGSRPTDLAEGDAKFYNTQGVSVHLEGQTLKIVAPVSIELKVGGSTFKLTNGRLDIDNCEIFNDGVRIDKTHVHKDVVMGTQLSGPPNP